jgi:hypothetical protein
MSPRSSLQLLLQKRHLTGSSLFSSTMFTSEVRLLRICGSFQTAEGERALEARSLSSSQISLWHEITRCPLFCTQVVHGECWTSGGSHHSAMEGQ